MSSNVIVHIFCSGCGCASTTITCDSCKTVTKEPESRIEIVIDVPLKNNVVVAVKEAVDIAVVTDDEEWEDKQRALRTLDDIEEAKRNGDWTGYEYNNNDDDDYEEDHYMCQCDNCAGYGDEYDYGDEGDCGLDWNESGYFD